MSKFITVTVDPCSNTEQMPVKYLWGYAPLESAVGAFKLMLPILERFPSFVDIDLVEILESFLAGDNVEKWKFPVTVYTRGGSKNNGIDWELIIRSEQNECEVTVQDAENGVHITIDLDTPSTNHSPAFRQVLNELLAAGFDEFQIATKPYMQLSSGGTTILSHCWQDIADGRNFLTADRLSIQESPFTINQNIMVITPPAAILAHREYNCLRNPYAQWLSIAEENYRVLQRIGLVD